MRQWIVGILFAAFLFAVGMGVANAQSAQVYRTCESVGEFAKTVMENRQAGLPMVGQINVVRQMRVAPSQESYMLNIIRLAYSKPRYSTYEYQRRSIDEFWNKTYGDCITNLSS